MRRAILLSVLTLSVACSKPAPAEQHEPAAPVAHVPWGAAMSEVGRRFEMLGKAEIGGRFELADYELGEIEETFEGTLPNAVPPKEGHPEVLVPMAKAFLDANVPDLQRAIASHDKKAFDAAFARTAEACNACHKASGHPFIEVPSVSGRGVPSTDPVAP